MRWKPDNGFYHLGKYWYPAFIWYPVYLEDTNEYVWLEWVYKTVEHSAYDSSNIYRSNILNKS